MKEDTLYNILIVITLIAIIAVLVLIFTTKTTESFTELYFENHENLPTTFQAQEFTFTIHNLENTNTEYNYKTTIEYFTSIGKTVKTQTIQEDTITLAHNETQSIDITFTPETYASAKVTTTVNDQEIHYWLK